MKKLIDFVLGIFFQIAVDAAEQPLFCGFPDDPNKNERWTPKTMRGGKLPNVIKKNHNNYFTLASYRTDPQGNYRAKKEYVVAVHAILLDDISPKMLAKIPLKPSWKVETSPGNYQCAFILKKPCTDLARYDAIVTAISEKGFSDKGAKGATRWARIPYGVNSKKKYLVGGKAPKVKLVYFYPDRRYSLRKIIVAFDLKLDIKGRKGRVTATSVTDNNGDAILSALKSAGLWKKELEPGKHDVTCPFVHLHTDKVDNGTAYFEPSPDNNQLGGFKCQHGHCSARNIADLKSNLGILDDPAKDQSNLDTALEIVDGINVFLDQYGEPFVFHDGHCSSLKSREIRALISREIYSSTKKAPKQSNLTEVLATLESKALCEGEKIELHLRIAWHKNFIWYDLGNKMAVRVGRKSWEIVDAPVLFRRYSHQQEQVTPIKGGNAWHLFDFLNISKKHQLETLVLLISYLVPDIAHPIFHPHGAQGSGKTTLCKLIKRLIDPSSLEVIFMPRDKNELIRQINRHHVPLFDNMSRLDYEQSDILCMSCTGGGIAKRVLYTDDDDRIYNFMRCIGLNGVNLLVTKPDILDRTMLIELERISPSERKLEAQLWREFNDAKPEILGGMFDTLTKAKAIFPSVKLAELPRLADFAKWGYAIAEALEKGLGKQFIADYQANVRRQNAEVLQSNNLCLAVTQFMRAREQWEGTVKTAYELLHQIVEPSKTDDTFPRDPKNLRKNLAYIQTTLAESEHITYRVSAKAKKDGYHIEFMKHK